MAEVRPIDGNSLIRYFSMKKANANPLDYNEKAIYAECVKKVETMPTIEAEPVLIVLRKNGVYDVYVGKQEMLTISRLSPDNIFSWLAKQRAVDIRFVDETIPNCFANMDGGKGNA